MAYDPMQGAMARANIVGRTVGNIGASVVDTASRITDIAKTEGINKKLNGAYVNILNRFADEAVSINPDLAKDRNKLIIAARKYYQPPVEGLDPKTNLTRMLQGDVNAQKFFDKLKLEVSTQKGATAAQTAVAGRQTPVTGFTEDVGPVMNQELPAQYQEQAISRYGEMQSQEQAPVQTAKQLRDQPSIAALPKTPEPPKPMTEYEKKKIELDTLKLKHDKLKTAKADEKDRDQNIRWATDKIINLDIQAKRDQQIVSKLKQAATKLGSDGNIPINLIQELQTEGIDTEELTLDKIKENINKYELLAEDSKKLSKEMTTTKKGLISGQTLSESSRMGGKALEEDAAKKEQAAYNYIKSYATPTLFKSVDVFLNSIPQEYRDILSGEIDDAKSKGASDAQILKAIKIKTNQ